MVCSMRTKILFFLLILTLINSNFAFAISIISVEITNVKLEYQCENSHIYGNINIPDGAIIGISIYDDEENEIGQPIETKVNNNTFSERLDINMTQSIVNVVFIIKSSQDVFKKTRIFISKHIGDNHVRIDKRVMVVK